MTNPAYPTILHAIRHFARRQPDEIVLQFLDKHAEVIDSHTWQSLYEASSRIGHFLASSGLKGRTVILLFPPGLEFVEAFLGCLFAGVIAVPAYPPRKNAHADRINAIIEDSGPACALTTAEEKIKIQHNFPELFADPGLQLTAHAEMVAMPATGVNWEFPLPEPGALAFLQYTSGSTGLPKGVMVNHDNLTVNLEALRLATLCDENSRFVSWLPAFHDMGLIFGILAPLFSGAVGYLMAPVNFVSRPILWLKAISHYGGTHTIAPNFAYDLCVETISPADLEGMDFRGVRFMCNAAEPVRKGTVAQMESLLKPFGLRPEALTAGYGLAEATLKVVISAAGSGIHYLDVDAEDLTRGQIRFVAENTRHRRTVTGCGLPLMDTRILITDPDSGVPCPPLQVGEVWIGGRTVAQGYWQKEEPTEEIFRARTADGEGPFLRTGDLGFVHGGDLYLTGRLKDVIIVHGLNHYPQDIEFTVRNSGISFLTGIGAAFTIEVEGIERIVIVQETHRNANQESAETLRHACDRIAEKVLADHELEVYAVLLVRKSAVPRTSSGKVRRKACKHELLEGNLEIIADNSPAKLQESFEPAKAGTGGMAFSLLYFSSNEAEFKENKYRLVSESAKFADQRGFSAVWLPERHFHPFGGLYPDPAVLAAWLAGQTSRIRLRSGSVVLPMHDPVLVAESWSVVDNISGGRVDMAFARGWNPNDFVLSPETFQNNQAVLFERVQELRKLWSGHSVQRSNGAGEPFTFRIFPLPVQPELQTWITCSGGEERFAEAGAIGANVLTALLFQTSEELADKIKVYREARRKNGFEPEQGIVTLMMHTFIGDDRDFVRRQVEKPFKEYLASSINLWKNRLEDLRDAENGELETLLDYAFERYYRQTALFGTVESCLETVRTLKIAGVNEIACLIDFGIPSDLTLKHLEHLDRLRITAGGTGASMPIKGAGPAPGGQKATRHNGLFQQPMEEMPSVDQSDPELPILGFEGKKQDYNLPRLRHLIAEIISQLVRSGPALPNAEKSFRELGLNSVKAIRLATGLSRKLGIEVLPTMLFEAPTINALAEKLDEILNGTSTVAADGLGDMTEEEIAAMIVRELQGQDSKAR